MIILDANLLIYAYDPTDEMHEAAAAWLQNAFSGSELIGLPWLSIAAFLRISTNHRLPGNRVSIDHAVYTVQSWIALDNVRVLSPSERHWAILQRVLIEGKVRGPLVTDAQLAALTIEYGGVLHTTDRDFARFPGLRWVNPLDGM